MRCSVQITSKPRDTEWQSTPYRSLISMACSVSRNWSPEHWQVPRSPNRSHISKRMEAKFEQMTSCFLSQVGERNESKCPGVESLRNLLNLGNMRSSRLSLVRSTLRPIAHYIPEPNLQLLGSEISYLWTEQAISISLESSTWYSTWCKWNLV